MAEHVTMKVTGMTCGGCEQAVQRVVAALPGVQSAAASHRDECVTVDYDAALVDRPRIAQAIERAGYKVGLGSE